MRFLLIDEFDDSVPITTTFRVQNNGIKLGYLRAHCYKRGVVTGSFTVTISQNAVDLASQTITSTDINAAVNATFGHGFFTWIFDNPIQLGVDPELDEQEYEITFTSNSYVGDANNVFAVCKDFDRDLVEDYGDNFQESPNSQRAATAPYGIELYTWDNE